MLKFTHRMRRWIIIMAALLSLPTVSAADYGLPAGIQQGNILHCFNWPIKDIIAELPNIAASGFGSVQISPVQRSDNSQGVTWHNLYRPYDLKFMPSSFCSEADLRNLCAQAETYGIKIIVDVVANHVDKTPGYHDSWWDSNNRVRWEGGINYGNRYSITHGQLGDYGDVNSEHSDVIARGKAYVEQLKSMGVKGIRWDAAKHIGLPSEGCGFWSAVTSVPGMWHYGEILDSPGPDKSIIKEYGKYMSVTDNSYSNNAARNNGGIPGGYAGEWAADYGLGDKVVYWGESHDTYSNDDWSQNVDQAVIDRAYAAFACRKDATALYLSRPNAKGNNNIKVGKGSTAFKNKAIVEVNRFRNAMVGKADYFSNSGNGNVCSITRKDGGAVIVMRGSGNVTATNGGGYCPTGTYQDRVTGNTFTVTASTITGTVGGSGIAVLYNGGTPSPSPDPTPDPTPTTSIWIIGNLGTAGWSATPGTGVQMTLSNGKYTAKNVKFELASAKETTCYFNLTDYVGATWDELNVAANRFGAATEGATVTLGSPLKVVKYANWVDASACKSWNVAPGTYDVVYDPAAMTITLTAGGSTPDPTPEPTPEPTPDPTPDPTPTPDASMWIIGNLGSAGWSATPGTGVAMTISGGKYSAKNVTFELASAKETKCYFNLTDYVGATWNELNVAANRYGAATEGEAVTLDSPLKVVKYANGVDASACKSWTVAPGTYDVVYDPTAMTITLSKAGSTPEPEPAPEPAPEPEPEPTPEPEPAPVPTDASFWLLGNIGEAGWSTTPGTGLPMYDYEGVPTAHEVSFETVTGETKCYFNITDYVGSTWDDLNKTANRYGAATEGEALTLGIPAKVVKYANGKDAQACKSWTVTPGVYDVFFDPSAMTIRIAEPSASTDKASLAIDAQVSNDATVYYNLQGVKVDRLTKGVVIVKHGDKVTKQFIK